MFASWQKALFLLHHFALHPMPCGTHPHNRQHIHHAADGVQLIDEILHGRCRMNKRSFRSYLFCVSDKGGEHSCFIKIVDQLSCCNGFCSVRCEIGQSSSALLDSDTTTKKFFCEILKADWIGKCHADFFTELVFVCFKLGLFQRQTLFSKNSVFFIQCKLSFLLCSILTLGHSVLTSVQKINLIQQTRIVTHLHDWPRHENIPWRHWCIGSSYPVAYRTVCPYTAWTGLP